MCVRHSGASRFTDALVVANMKVITAIYLHCRPELRDEWLSGTEVEDVGDAHVCGQISLAPSMTDLHHRLRSKRCVFSSSSVSTSVLQSPLPNSTIFRQHEALWRECSKSEREQQRLHAPAQLQPLCTEPRRPAARKLRRHVGHRPSHSRCSEPNGRPRCLPARTLACARP